jgi:hypothetical protein
METVKIHGRAPKTQARRGSPKPYLIDCRGGIAGPGYLNTAIAWKRMIKEPHTQERGSEIMHFSLSRIFWNSGNKEYA